MNSQRSRITHSKNKSHVETASSSSDYSTCSDNPQMNMYWSKQKFRESDILAGQITERIETRDVDLNQPNSDTVLEDTNISPLNLNIDVLSDTDFTDCRESLDSHNDSTMYAELPLACSPKENELDFENITSNEIGQYQKAAATEFLDSSPVAGTLQQRLVTIIEEREITHTTVKDLSPSTSNHHTGPLVTEMYDQLETNQENNNNIRKVLFLNVADNQNNKVELKKTQKLSNCRTKWPRQVNDSCKHNTTESFVLWEKYCEASEKLASRRSFSFSDLNLEESCTGDDELSTSYKTIDDMQLSRSSVETENHDRLHPRITRSKSCESILQEVKHLPHLLYDRFLRCLSKEIDRLRRENVVCTCQKVHKKSCNKENERKRIPKKPALKLTNKTINTGNGQTEPRATLQVPTFTGAVNKMLSSKSHGHARSAPIAPNITRLSPETAIQSGLSPGSINRTNLSPETTLKTSSQFPSSPKSPAKTPTTPSKNRYFCWNKQIVSPVGEYIRGKRQSPFQSSPNKRK